MSFANDLVFRLKRSNSWPVRLLKKTVIYLFSPALPPLPRFILPPFRLLAELHYFWIVIWRFLLKILYYNPATQARCASVGRGFFVEGLPFITGHVEIHCGNNVGIYGQVRISSGAIYEKPQLIIKDRSSLGWGTTVTVNREVVIEEDVIISYNVNISDSDGHRREADLRVAGVRPDPKDVLPVRICKNAWIGNGAYIMKGVTIGEGAVIGANSVVISNIPAFSLALGNPAEVLIKNYGRPSTARGRRATGDSAPPVTPAAQDTT